MSGRPLGEVLGAQEQRKDSAEFLERSFWLVLGKGLTWRESRKLSEVPELDGGWSLSQEGGGGEGARGWEPVPLLGMRAMLGAGRVRAVLGDEQRETGMTPQSDPEEPSGAV